VTGNQCGNFQPEGDATTREANTVGATPRFSTLQRPAARILNRRFGGVKHNIVAAMLQRETGSGGCKVGNNDIIVRRGAHPNPARSKQDARCLMYAAFNDEDSGSADCHLNSLDLYSKRRGEARRPLARKAIAMEVEPFAPRTIPPEAKTL
jgi:hypothetical protein